MKFAQRTAQERTAIDAWIRVTIAAREKEGMDVADDFRTQRQKRISESPEDVAKMVRMYADYQQGAFTVSYTEYFQVANPQECAALIASEKMPKA